MLKRVYELFTAACGAALSFFTGLPPLIWVLLAVMCLDYITGLMCGWKGASPKTENGKLSSKAAFEGLLKKVLILIVVGLASLVDMAISSAASIEMVAVTGATCLWFVASEGLSVLENAAAMGVKIPKALQKALEIMQEKNDGKEDKNHGTDGFD